MGAKLKVRQPLAKVEVVLIHPQYQVWLEAHTGLIREELNVKQVEFIPRADQYITYTVLPDLKRLGPRLGKRLPALRQALAAADAAALLGRLETDGKVTFDLPDGLATLDSNDIQVRLQAKPGWAAAQGPRAVVVVSTELTEDLQIEGVARDLVHAVQNLRKEKNCQFTDRVVIGIVTDSDEVLRAVHDFADYVKSETLAVEIKCEAISSVEPVAVELAGHKVTLYIRVADSAMSDEQ
jgi:isoleucyl-tRNA synthetase